MVWGRGKTLMDASARLSSFIHRCVPPNLQIGCDKVKETPFSDKLTTRLSGISLRFHERF